MSRSNRRLFLRGVTGAAAGAFLGPARSVGGEPSALSAASPESGIRFQGNAAIDEALRIAAGIYPRNRRKDALSSFYSTGYRMTVSPGGFPVALCISPDLTFGVFGSRYHPDDLYIKTFVGILDTMPRSMRRNGKFYINEDMLLIGGDRVMNQVMYPIWVWELYLATGDARLLRRHLDPLRRCLGYIESRTDSNGIVNQVDHDDWQYSEGADWVDWSPERMEGSTCVYHTWYARSLGYSIQAFRVAGDQKTVGILQARRQRLLTAIDTRFWNGRSYYDNLNFNGRKVNHFWTDSQVWPIAYGLASREQAGAIVARIDAHAEYFEGTPTRWCPSVSDAEAVELARDYPDAGREPHLRPFTWFGRLGSGDILARCALDQHAQAFRLLDRYCRLVVKHGTCMECLDMQGHIRKGTQGGRDYLEHAGGLLLAAGRGLWGIDDTADGTLVWRPWLPPGADNVCLPCWHMGHCWKFGYENGACWIDPQGGQGRVHFILAGKEQVVDVTGRRVTLRST
jgi:hypothetical protein